MIIKRIILIFACSVCFAQTKEDALRADINISAVVKEVRGSAYTLFLVRAVSLSPYGCTKGVK